MPNKYFRPSEEHKLQSSGPVQYAGHWHLVAGVRGQVGQVAGEVVTEVSQVTTDEQVSEPGAGRGRGQSASIAGAFRISETGLFQGDV